MTGTDEDFRAWRTVLTLSKTESSRCHDAHHLHQLVLAGFRNPSHRTAEPVEPEHMLYAAYRPAAKPDKNGRRTANPPERVLVQSLQPPTWEQHVMDRRLTLGQGPFEVRNAYSTGDLVEIRLIGNPTRRERTTGKRRVLASPAECGEWLQRRMADHGLDIKPGHISMSAYERVTGIKGENKINVMIRTLHARGTVTDPPAFHHAHTQGIGRAKAYGCGLLRSRIMT